MTFGEKVRSLRKEKKMSQQELASMVGVSYRTIRSWEVEGRFPKQNVLYQKLADALQCDVSYLCLLYTSPSPRDAHESRMPSSA